ncbi:hypothetical protein BC936DRAFT_138213 [Jimgerdemannia flammicorona]|uniref:Guided entry of tail-anchored proteins 1 n=1 Tax=Jimgerdemannia flammicorona TaxID=994334 RepID=A0A433CVJ4_9FUNG|nr:hypothetical protein BC936DRAFT_138213 [Jimgerdemannia flammicorona]
MFLAVTVLLLVIITEGILWFGYSYITSLAYGVYLFLVRTETLDAQRALKKRILQLKAEIGRTSSQNEFAKWAKLRRKLDGGVAELEKLSAYWGARPFLVFAAFLFYFILFATFFILTSPLRRRPSISNSRPFFTSSSTAFRSLWSSGSADPPRSTFPGAGSGHSNGYSRYPSRRKVGSMSYGWHNGVCVRTSYETSVAMIDLWCRSDGRNHRSTWHHLSRPSLTFLYFPAGSVSVAIWFVICRKVCKSSVQIVASFLPEGTAEALAHVAGVVVKQVTAWGEAAGAAVQAAVGAAVQAAAGTAVQAAAGTAVQAAAGTAVPVVEGETVSVAEKAGAVREEGGAKAKVA